MFYKGGGGDGSGRFGGASIKRTVYSLHDNNKIIITIDDGVKMINAQNVDF